MNEKLKTISQALTKIEELDEQIRQHLEKQDYGEIIKIMPVRMSIICQINKLKEKNGISIEDKKQLDELFNGAKDIQKTILSKKDKIGERLKKRKTVVSQNKKLRY
ncbi:MAG: hypothetical protein O3C63_08890 [Cyanobacteria bacterium]|nr:hypothetical protein [Cyanobacteriota bacterium]MDA1021155.1 hypothetical protein [Cyanobacteriota bacterium]